MRDSVRFVVGARVVLGVVVGPVLESGIPVIAELFFVSRGTVTTRGAYPPSWPKGGAIVLLVTPAAAEC